MSVRRKRNRNIARANSEKASLISMASTPQRKKSENAASCPAHVFYILAPSRTAVLHWVKYARLTVRANDF